MENEVVKGLKEKIITNAIKNLNEFGYEHVTPENIMTDDVYSQFFRSMLNDNLGKNKTVDVVLNQLLDEVKR